jgi:hypothetical protein
MKMETGEAKPGLPEAKSGLASAAHTAIAQQQNATFPVLGSIVSVRTEIDDVLSDMKVFHKAEPDQVMGAVSAHSARLVEIVVQIQRIEPIRREWKPVREEAERVLSELKNQFAVASRVLAMRAQDWEMSGRGQI